MLPPGGGVAGSYLENFPKLGNSKVSFKAYPSQELFQQLLRQYNSLPTPALPFMNFSEVLWLLPMGLSHSLLGFLGVLGKWGFVFHLGSSPYLMS